MKVLTSRNFNYNLFGRTKNRRTQHSKPQLALLGLVIVMFSLSTAMLALSMTFNSIQIPTISYNPPDIWQTMVIVDTARGFTGNTIVHKFEFFREQKH
jgi:hypothetical protein